MKKILIPILISILLAGCQSMLPGKLYSLQDANVMDFEIQTSYGTGDMTAYNHKTGERFTGQYTGTYKGGGTATSLGGGRYSGSSYSSGTISQHSGRVSSTATTFIPPSDATARGVLMGDKGTVIELYMEIRPGIVPKGHGEGIDNHGNRYQVQF